MKQTYLHLVACAVAAFALAVLKPAAAAPVTSDQAIAAASAWVAQNASFGAVGDASSVVPEYDVDGSLLWWQVVTSRGSSIFTAPDDEMEPVIAAIPNLSTAIPSNHVLRVMLTRDIRIRARRLAKLVTNGAPRMRSGASASASAASSAQGVSAMKSKWARLVAAGKIVANGPRIRSGKTMESELNSETVIVLPGFEEGGVLTHWNQSGPYGYYTYYMDSKAYGEAVKAAEEAGGEPPDVAKFRTDYPCGCVATATAAVLQYFEARGPIVAVRRPVTMELPDNGGIISTNLVTIGQTNHYDWAALPRRYGGRSTNPTLTEEGERTLGRATYDAGVCLRMAYAEKGSGASTRDVASVLHNDFGFASSEWKSFNPYGDEISYTNAIYREVQHGYPVVMSIAQEGAAEGHCVVAVGYGEDSEQTPYTRVFMGWGGSSDGWYSLPIIDAGTGPTGGEDENPYNLLNGVVTHIRYEGYRKLYAYSPMAAQQDALERGVPILLVGGCEGDTDTDELINYVNDNNLTNRFAVYFSSSYYDPFTCNDTKLAIGVFNPALFETSDRWSSNGNGVLSYLDLTNGVDTAAIEATLSEGELAYFAAMEFKAPITVSAGHFVTNEVRVLDFFASLFAGRPIYVWITNQVWEAFEVCTPEPGYGTADYIVGGKYRFHMPIVATNFAEGVVWQCTGWTATNMTNGVTALVRKGTNNWCDISVGRTNDNWTLVWEWKEQALRVQVSTGGDPGATISPADAYDMWVPPYSEITLLATSSQTGNLKYAFRGWDCAAEEDDNVFGWDRATEDADNPRRLTLSVVKPVRGLQAVFERAGTRDPVLPEPAAIVAAVEPVDSGAPAPDFDPTAPEDPDPPSPPDPPEPQVVQPDPIAFSMIEYDADAGIYLLKVTNGVKYCTYTLYESPVPTSDFTVKATVVAPYSENPYTAVSNGPVFFSVPKGDTTKFWGVKAKEGTVTE